MAKFEPTNKNLQFYNSMPIFMQNFLCSVKGWHLEKTRYNADFHKMLAEFNSRKNWSYEQICAYRDKRLRAIVKHAYETVPYYKKLFDKAEVDYHQIKTIDDLQIIPITTKDDIINNYNDCKSVGYDISRCYPAHTSGTTGAGLQFMTTPESAHAQWAGFWRARQELGISFSEWSGSFGNKLIVPRSQVKPPYWRISYPGKMIYFSGYHEKNENLYAYYDYIKRKKLSWLHGYPSLLMALATFMVDNNLNFDFVKYVTTAAENLLPYQIKTMKDAFGVRPVQVYSQTEEVALFHQNLDGTIYVDEDFSAVEFLPLGNGQYSVVGTNLYNYAFPFIRYATKDTVTLPDVKVKNGRRVVDSIDGRLEDYIYLPDGTKIGKFYHVFEDTPGFAEVQIHQNEDYSITIFAVKRTKDIIRDEKKASDMMKLSIGDAVPFSFEYVDSVPKTKSGKLRFIVSDVLERV